MYLVAVAEAAQDLHGVVDRRLLDPHLLEAPLKRGVALEVLAVLVVGGTDRLQLAACRAGLRMEAASIAPSAAPAPTRLWSSSMKRMMSPLHDLLHHLLQHSSNSPRYFEPATSAARSSV